MDRDSYGHPALIPTVAAMVLIYPITVLDGSRSLLLVISCLCVSLDAWSVAGAARNVLDGLPALAALAALWATIAVPPARIARRWTRFVPAATGLIMALILEGLSIRASGPGEVMTHIQAAFPSLWVVGGPVVVAAANLSRLIRARNRVGEPTAPSTPPAPNTAIPRPHVPLGVGRTPVTLVPYRPPEARSSRSIAS
jgi:hypothetical protein